jgi:hypothetical protein
LRKTVSLLVALPCALLTSAQSPGPAPSSENADGVAEVLRRQTQELLDGITDGSPAAWERYLDEKATITAEDGSVLKKAELVPQIKPLPEGVSGRLEVIDFEATVHGPVAVANYVADEHETYHGHALACQYRITDTWIETPGGWRLIASQILALRTDPPAIELATQRLLEYVGRYTLTPEIAYEIRLEGGRLEGQRTGREPDTLLVEAPDVLFVPGSPRYRKVFKRGQDGRITGFAERREAWDIEWARSP